MSRSRRMEYAETLREIRRWADASAGPEWTEDEWRGLIRRAIRQTPEPPRAERTPLWRPVLAAASMLAALVGGAWFLAQEPAKSRSPVPDSRAGEMLPADPGALVSRSLDPGRLREPRADVGRNPFLPNPPEKTPGWIFIHPGAKGTVFLFIPQTTQRDNRR